MSDFKKKDKKVERWEDTEDTTSKPKKWSESKEAKGKFESYQTAGVDEVGIRNITEDVYIKVKKVPVKSYPDEIPESQLIRKSDNFCPNCQGVLYNTLLDGIYFYCPKCKMQHRVVE